MKARKTSAQSIIKIFKILKEQNFEIINYPNKNVINNFFTVKCLNCDLTRYSKGSTFLFENFCCFCTTQFNILNKKFKNKEIKLISIKHNLNNKSKAKNIVTLQCLKNNCNNIWNMPFDKANEYTKALPPCTKCEYIHNERLSNDVIDKRLQDTNPILLE